MDVAGTTTENNNPDIMSYSDLLKIKEQLEENKSENFLMIKEGCKKCKSTYNALKILGMIEQDNIKTVNYTEMKKTCEKYLKDPLPNAHGDLFKWDILKIDIPEPDLPILLLNGEFYSGVKLNIFLGGALGCLNWMLGKEMDEATFNDIKKNFTGLKEL